MNVRDWVKIFSEDTVLDAELAQLSGSDEKQKKSYAFEALLGQFLAEILGLPFQDSSEETSSFHKIRWLGKINPFTAAGNKMPDLIGNLFGYDIVIECTLYKGAHQSSKEFAPTVEHKESAIDKSLVNKESFTMLVAPTFHQQTYLQFKNLGDRRTVLLSLSQLSKIAEASRDIFHPTNTLFKWLLTALSKALNSSTSLNDFNDLVDKAIDTWKKDLLLNSFERLIAIESFKILQQLAQKERTKISVGEIFRSLQTNERFKALLEYSEFQRSPTENIEKICRSFGLVHTIPSSYDEDQMLEILDWGDFASIQRGLNEIFNK